MNETDKKNDETAVGSFVGLTLQTRVLLTRDDPAHPFTMGRGVAELLHGVREFGSLNQAAKELNMAYSKAWTLMRTMEASFGAPLLSRDGAHGSSLTADGERLLKLYDGADAAVSEYARKALPEDMGETDA